MYNSDGGIMLHNVLNEILNLPHFSNAKGEHETKIQDLLISGGFSSSTIEEQGLRKKDIRKCLVDNNIQPNVFIAQPCGSQSFPDFIVSDENGVVRYIECKSSKDDKIVWNSGRPKSDAIYIVSSGKHNKQTLVLGSDLWDDTEYQLVLEAFEKMKEIQKKYYALLKNMGSKLRPYCREMFNDGYKIYGHKDRELRVQKVFNSLKENSGEFIRDIKAVL